MATGQCTYYIKKKKINKKYNPWDYLENNTEGLPLGLDELFVLAKDENYCSVKVCFDNTGNSAYYYKETGELEDLCGWIDLKDWENGGEFTNDPNRNIKKEEFDEITRKI